ncbi:MAG TPA: diguanylate cyclase [Candidatus Limnocylindrales bacterium]
MTTYRLVRRLVGDPHLMLAIALVIPMTVVNLLERGPNEAVVAALAVAFLAGQASLALIGPSTSGLTSLRPRTNQPRVEAWALARLTLAVAFVASAAFATADLTTVPLAPLYIPIIALAAAIGPGEAIAIFGLVFLARFLPIIEGPVRASALTEQALVLGAVAIVLAIGTRRTVASLNIALDRLRSTNASERRRTRQIAGIDAVGRTLAADGPIPRSLDDVMDLLTGPFGYSHGSIYLGEELGGTPTELRMGAQHGYDLPIPVFDGTAGVIGRVMRTRAPALVPDVHVDPDYIGAATGLRSEVCAPLLAGTELLGIVNVESDREVLDEHDLDVVRLVADRLASALTLARERRRLAERAQLFQAVVQFGGEVTSSLDSGILYDKIVAGLGSLVRTDVAGLTLLDRRDGTYRMVAIQGGDPTFVGLEIRSGEGTAGRAIRDRAAVLDDHFDRRRFPAGTTGASIPDVVASVGVPLIRDQVVLGAIALIRFDARPFSELELEVLQLVASQVALAITNAQLHAEVMEASIRDSLTGTFNRRHLEPSLERMIASRRRLPFDDRPALGAILFDLDLFGSFNKLHGHQTGDAVLRAFGQLLLERFRASDLVARYGGEEFVVILDGSGRAEAFRIAEEVRVAFAQQSFRGATGERLVATVSAGCAELGPDDGLSELLGACDVGLAMAKGAGRNQVVAA